MKTLLVFALAFAGAIAEDKPVVYTTATAGLPLSWGINNLAYSGWGINNLAYSAPLTYSALPIQTVQNKLVPKEYEVEVKTIEFTAAESDCKNSFGMAVPCAKSKRSAEEEKEEKKAIVYSSAMPWGLNAWNTLPMAYNTLPYAYNTLPYMALSGCRNSLGMAVPCARAKRSAEEEKEEKKAIVYSAAMPWGLNAWNTYNSWPASPVVYKAAEPIIREIEVPTPVLKKVVEKVPLMPACQNAWGFPVACNLA